MTANYPWSFKGGVLTATITVMSFIIKGSIAFSSPDYLSTLSQCIDELQHYSKEMMSMHQVDDLEQRSYRYTGPNLEQISDLTPAYHYAKNNPGAGWAGYKHPLYGGYLENLKQNNVG